MPVQWSRTIHSLAPVRGQPVHLPLLSRTEGLFPKRHEIFFCDERLRVKVECVERLRGKVETSTRLAYIGFHRVLEHLKIETRLTDERFESVKGEYVI